MQAVLVSCVVVALLYVLVFYVLRSLFRRTSFELGSVALRVSEIPALVVAVLGILDLFVLPVLTTVPGIIWIQRVLTAAIVVVATYWVAQLLIQVVVYYLKEFSERSEAQWDDVLVPILETSVPILIYILGGSIALQAIGLNLTGLWVALGGAAFILGFALKDILSDFFSGLVLLIDTPFRFGDVVTLEDGTQTVIRQIGLRVTNLYVFNQHCELYVPNSVLHGQKILNMSRPTAHYYYTLTLPVKNDADPTQVGRLLEAVTLAHPDTLGDIDLKLQYLEQYYGCSGDPAKADQKRDAGRARLMAERALNLQLMKVEDGFDRLAEKIRQLEKSGLDGNEIREIQTDFVELCQLIGMEPTVNWSRKQRSFLEESRSEERLIGLVRQWYQCWLKDPDLLQEDHFILPKQWEQKLEFLKRKMSRLFRKLANPAVDDSRLDDAVKNVSSWMRENFKTTRNEWQEPKVWLSDVLEGMNKNFSVKFYVDDITLEHCERGNRVESEIKRELAWQLRRAYLSL
jgi:MscS family membrane protein